MGHPRIRRSIIVTPPIASRWMGHPAHSALDHRDPTHRFAMDGPPGAFGGSIIVTPPIASRWMGHPGAVQVRTIAKLDPRV